MNITGELKKRIISWGANKAGIADISRIRELKTNPPDLLKPFKTAVSIALRVPSETFEQISDAPTPIYANVYRTANMMLDNIAFKACLALENYGYGSLAVPASQILDKKNWHGAISHKAVAVEAGLGWQGKNLLLITPEFGSRVRLVTILTKAPLASDSPVKNRCGKCTLCADACPADAIKNVNTENHYASRNEALHFSRCVKKLTEDFASRPHIGNPICGVCIKVCPFGRYKKTKQ